MSLHSVDIPSGQTPVTVKVINAVNFGPSQLHRFMAPPVPGLETFPRVPSFSFLLEHPSGRKLVWDLGIRKDYWNMAEKIAKYIPTTGYDIQVDKDVAEILEENGVSVGQIEAVIWSHWHWDHIGNPARFPRSTALIVGAGFKEAMLPGAPRNRDSPILESDYEGRELREISFQGANSLRIGQFPAYDYFGDGSFYLLDSPGHAVGHMCGLARTTTSSDSFVLLGGDVCHYSGILRPSSRLPTPSHIPPRPSSSAVKGLCLDSAFEKLQRSRQRTPEEPVYYPTYGHDIPLAMNTINKLQELDCDDRIFVIIAHDAIVCDIVDHFPQSLNDWAEKGWGKAARWAFLHDFENYWQAESKGEHACRSQYDLASS